jgi:hypothetical protein
MFSLLHLQQLCTPVRPPLPLGWTMHWPGAQFNSFMSWSAFLDVLSYTDPYLIGHTKLALFFELVLDCNSYILVSHRALISIKLDDGGKVILMRGCVWLWGAEELPLFLHVCLVNFIVVCLRLRNVCIVHQNYYGY